MARKSTRLWARSLSTRQLARDIEHCRSLWGCIRDDRYDAYYAVTIGIYRAELAQRS